MKKRTTLVVLVGLLLLVLIVPSVVAEGSKEKEEKVQFSVGFNQDEAIETLRPDEAWQYSEMGCIFWPVIYDMLWTMGPAPDYEAVPRLATSWETEDNKTWTFHLRDDAYFHDGEKVTAEDVAFSLQTLPDHEPSFDYPDVDVTEVNIIDDYTIEFTLADVHAGAGKYPPANWFPILPKHVFEEYEDDVTQCPNENAIGSGPYKLKEFKAGEYVWFETFDKHWDEKGPQVDEMVFRMYGSVDAMIMAMKKGEIHMIGYGGVDPLVAKEFQNTEDFEIVENPGIELNWLTFNLHKDTPLQDDTVRKAIMYGIDRQRIIDMVYIGYAEPVYSFIYPEMNTFNENIEKYNYNPDKAKQMLEEAGYTDTDGDGIRNDPETGENLVFEASVQSYKTHLVKLMQIIEETIAEVGVKLEVTPMDQDTLLEYIYAPTEDKYEISMIDEEPGPYADWVWEFARSYEGGGEGWNAAYYNSKEFDRLLAKMYQSLDRDVYVDTVKKMQKLLAEDLPYGFMIRRITIDPVPKGKFEGYTKAMGGFSSWTNPWTYYRIRPVE
jgi:peptide/nickel transport system substrate-binding protein